LVLHRSLAARTALASEALERTGLAVEAVPVPIGARNSCNFRGTAALAAAAQNTALEVVEEPWSNTTSTTRLGPVVPLLVPRFAQCPEEQSKASVWCPAGMRAPEPKYLAPEEHMTLLGGT
jgi:hypothetical protein